MYLAETVSEELKSRGPTPSPAARPVNGEPNLKAAGPGKKAVMTEPAPLYLLAAAGVQDATPEAYTSAVEEQQDVPPAALRATLDLVSSRSVALLAYTPQTEGPQTQQLRNTAEAAKVPVVDFTETVPDGEDYLGWMQENVAALKKALA